MKIKVLFICHGNICRSPMAEFILKKKIASLGLSDRFFVASAATSTEEIWNGVGNPVYPPARAELKRHGIDCGGKRAVQLARADYDKYDYLIGMDSANIRNMLVMTGGRKAGEGRKIYRMMEFAGESRDVADPWYSGDFEKTYEDIDRACDGLLKFLIEKRA